MAHSLRKAFAPWGTHFLFALLIVFLIFGHLSWVAEWGPSVGALVSGAVLFSLSVILFAIIPYSQWVIPVAIGILIWLWQILKDSENKGLQTVFKYIRSFIGVLARLILFLFVLGLGSIAILNNIWVARGATLIWVILILAVKRTDWLKRNGFDQVAKQINWVLAIVGIGSISWLGVQFLCASSSGLLVHIFSHSTSAYSSRSPRIYDLAVEKSHAILFDDKKAGIIGRIGYPEGALSVSEKILFGPERILPTPDGRIFVFCKEKSVGLYEVAQDLSGAAKLFHYPAVDADLDETRNLIILADEHWPKVAIYHYPDQKLDKYALPKFIAPYALTIASKNGGFFVSGWFFSIYLIKGELAPDNTVKRFHSKVVGPFSMGMALDENKGLIYLAKPLIGKIDVLRIDDLSRVERISAPMWLREIALSDDGSLLFAPNYFTGEMAVIRTADARRCATYYVGSSARAVVFSAQHRALFVANTTQINELPIAKLPVECTMEYK